MDVDLLKTFLEVHKTRHFGKAADNLYITQSTVSARIKQLEDIVGVKLFHRDRKNITPTASGEKLLSHAENILSMWNRVKLDVASEQYGKIPLNIGAVSSLWDIYMQRWLKEVSQCVDKFLLNCNVVSPENIHGQITDGTLDFAFTYEPPSLDKIVIARQISIRFVLVSSHEHISCDQAMQNDYIYVDWGTPFAISHSQQFHDLNSPTLRLAVGRTARDFIIRHGGSAYLPTTMIKRDLEKKRLFKVANAPIIKRDAYLIVNNENPRYNDILELARE